MPMHMTPEEYADAIRALGRADAPTVAEEDTKPSAPLVHARVKESLSSLNAVQYLHTVTYRLLAAAIQLSNTVHGANVVGIVPGGYAIPLSATVAYGVDITQPRVTVVSLHARIGGKWRKLESQRLPKLAPQELLALFVSGKE